MDEKSAERRVGEVEQPPPGPDETTKHGNELLVEYGGAEDLDNPKNWSSKYKWLMVFILSGMSLTT